MIATLRQRLALPIVAAMLMLIGLAAFAVAGVAAQAGEPLPGVDDPTAAMLASVTGVAVIVAALVNLFRPFLNEVDFDRLAPIIAVGLGILLALLGAVQRGSTEYVDAALVGLFGGMSSQLVNKVAVRTIQAVRGDPPQ